MFRQILSVVGNLPAVLMVTVGPFIGMLQGHLHFPQILISDLMNVPNYKAVLGIVSVTVVSVDIYLFVEVLKHTRKRVALDSYWHTDLTLCLLVFCIYPGNLLVVFFPFEEVGLYWFLHCAGAAVFFSSMAGIGFIYTFFLAPILRERDVVPKQDAWFRQWLAIMVLVMVVVGACVRPFHLADPHGWAWPLLAVEVVFSLIGILATVLGNWRTLGELDRTDPVAFAYGPASKEG